MWIIYSLPLTMHTLQTILLEKATLSMSPNWDLPALKLQVMSDKCCVQAAGENLGTKLDVSQTSNALAVESGSWRPKQRDPNNPTWLS